MNMHKVTGSSAMEQQEKAQRCSVCQSVFVQVEKIRLLQFSGGREENVFFFFYNSRLTQFFLWGKGLN